MNRGILNGVATPGYKEFNPSLKGFNATSSAITQPNLADSVVTARWLREPSGKVFYYGNIVFGANATFGSGSSVWGLELPIPANRSSNGADLPIGQAYAWQGTVSSKNMVLTATLMDPLFFGGNRTSEDYYAQFFISSLETTGTGSIATGSTITSPSITHGLPSTPNIFDILIVPTNSPNTAPRNIYISNVGATTFDVNVGVAATTTGLSFAWKAKMAPNGATEFDLLTNYNKPWTWAANHVIGWNLVYEGRR